MKGIFIILFAIAALIYACEPCPDCGEPLYFEPTIDVKFINEDSLAGLDSTISILTVELSTLKKKKDSIDTEIRNWLKKIDQLADSIEAGKTEYIQDTIDIRNNITSATDNLNTTILPIQKIKKTNDSTLQVARKSIASGFVKVNRITLLQTGKSLPPDTGRTLYKLPLLMNENATLTSYEIDIENKVKEISFEYETEIRVDAKGKVKVRAFGIGIDTARAKYTYETPPKIVCETKKCEDNEVLVTIYF